MLPILIPYLGFDYLPKFLRNSLILSLRLMIHGDHMDCFYIFCHAYIYITFSRLTFFSSICCVGFRGNIISQWIDVLRLMVIWTN